MKRILISGATGNIGIELVHYLSIAKANCEIRLAVRDVKKAKDIFKDYPELKYIAFDFEDANTFAKAFKEIDILFLLRPPHISEVNKVFKPLLNMAKETGIEKIVFLSVQGAEKSRIIPHHKIELLIQDFGFKYIFIRPSYFMQNLTTTLLPEIKAQKRISLPSGKAKFNWVDVNNVGEAAAELLLNFDTHQNNAYDITGMENLDFGEVAKLLSGVLGEHIDYRPINPIRYYFEKKKAGIKSGFAMVMTILHFLPRIQARPKLSDHFQKLCGKQPSHLHTFIEREKERFI